MALKPRNMLTRNDLATAQSTAAAITAAINSGSGFQYVGSVAVTDADWLVARNVGAARTAIARANGLNSSKYRRGDDDARVDAEGALGEWLASCLLDRHPDVQVAAYVAHKAPKGEVDLVLSTKRIDVKALGLSGSRNVNINAEQHVTKRPDAYLIVQLVTENLADLYVVRAAELALTKAEGGGWEMRSGWSPYYNCYLKRQLEAPPIAALRS